MKLFVDKPINVIDNSEDEYKGMFFCCMIKTKFTIVDKNFYHHKTLSAQSPLSDDPIYISISSGPTSHDSMMITIIGINNVPVNIYCKPPSNMGKYNHKYSKCGKFFLRIPTQETYFNFIKTDSKINNIITFLWLILKEIVFLDVLQIILGLYLDIKREDYTWYKPVQF